MAKRSDLLLLSLVGLGIGLGASLAYALARREPASREKASREFRHKYARALADDQQRANVLDYQRRWRAQRDSAFEGLDFAALRRRVAEAKNEVLRGLPHYVKQFQEAAEKAGAIVYHAADADDANRYIVELARRKGIGFAVKGKSMVSEETHLNDALLAAGIRPVETDFGEWIIQLAHDHPSHMVLPAIHKNRFQIAALINEATGQQLSGDDIPGLTAAARRTLRQEFLGASMGITGANALIAESGTVMTIENEGNHRLTTSLPAVHVVLAGYEKLLPTFDDAAAQLRVLGRSGTGQTITTYTNFITGVDRPGREVHIVLVDNGRSSMLADADFVDALRCIRCGACANVCPPYQVVGGHVFGYVYTGAIGLVNTPFYHGLEHGAGPQSLCLSCNACATVCPVEIPLPRQILDVRARTVRQMGLAPHKRLAFALWSQPKLFGLAARLGALVQTPLVKDGYLRRLPLLGRLPLTESLRWRDVPALAARPARDRLLARASLPAHDGPLAASKARGLTVAYFIQCITDRFFPEMAEATVEILEACGAHVVVPPQQHCCGLPAFDSGDRSAAMSAARQTIETLERVEADYIVSGATSCVVMMTHDYQHLFADDAGWKRRAERMAQRVMDLSTFLHDVAQLPDGILAGGEPRAVAYHDFCQGLNVAGIQEAPRWLIRDVMGCELRELGEIACCGFGGSFSVDHPGVAAHIVERKLQNVDATEAPLLVTDNPGCIMHMRGAARASGRSVRVLHVAELVAARLNELRRGTTVAGKGAEALFSGVG